MYNLCVDIGNSWIKGAYFNQSDEIEHTFLCKNPGEKLGRELNRMDMPIQYAIVFKCSKARHQNTTHKSRESARHESIFWTTHLIIGTIVLKLWEWIAFVQ